VFSFFRVAHFAQPWLFIVFLFKNIAFFSKNKDFPTFGAYFIF